MQQNCVTCRVDSSEAESLYELIGEHGWRPKWNGGSIRHAAVEWFCPTCWQSYKEAAQREFPSTRKMLAQAAIERIEPLRGAGEEPVRVICEEPDPGGKAAK